MRKILLVTFIMTALAATAWARDVGTLSGGDIVVGTAVPSGTGFDVTLSAPAIARANKVSADIAATARFGAGSTDAEFGASVRREATRHLKELFPNGVPPGAASKIKVQIRVTLSKPPVITIVITA